MITDSFLESEDRHRLGGVQRIYRFANGKAISAVNSPMIHGFSFAWELAVIASDGNLDYDTELTHNVIICKTDEEANSVIERAGVLFGTVPKKAGD